ncbi:ABC transporter [Aerococcus urinaehominis]|uniref:ABC transporter n=1 Tax=Aerococcus urinaehominis TaxID=128944 RepID=A0A0X8FM22_9LACT|nr:ABC transporter ATP-binding protein [Aerococcus urinaehominis]AMB99794.1 ABC transporter [Aerococcus urinaehominis]SDM08769.1 ATP-binding cassette, subfamily B, multidrug efflux pump [Aerococcus urinaehominis]
MTIKESLARLWPYMRPKRLQFFGALLMSLLQTISQTLEPFVIGLAITEVTKNVVAMAQGVPGAGINYDYILKIMVLYFARGMVYHVSMFLGQFWLTNVVQSAIYDLRNDIAEKINRLPVAYFDRHQVGDVLSRMTNDVDAVSNAMQQSFIQLANGFLSISFAIAFMLYLKWQLALIIIVMIPLNLLLGRLILNWSQPAFQAQADALGDLFAFTQEQLSGFTEIKVYGQQEESVKAFEAKNHQLYENGFRASFLSGLMMPLFNMIANACYLVIAVVGGLMTIAGRLTVGNLQAFVQYVWQINQPITMITQMMGLIQSAFAACQRIFSFLDEAEEDQSPAKAQLRDQVAGQVEFDHVGFGYHKDKPLMTDINFTVKPGDTVAVVGPTGAGKTTLINLLMRFYDVDKGAIKIDGIDIKDLDRADLRSHMGMVLQDAWLYTDTIEENIRFGDLQATDYQVRDAAKVANVDHFISTLPSGYKMEINEEANNVSLGQKQLMTIARAIIADPDILILDEATSSVDTRLEKLIQGAMDKIMEGRTSFVIAHRLSTIRNADMILVMQEGNIIEHGNHEELLAADGFYADLYRSQFNEDDPAEISMGY